MQRANILQQGINLTTGDRNQSYGDPHTNLTRMAALVNAQFDTHFNSGDMAIIMVMAKLSRIGASVLHEDNYVDGATYMAIAGECYAQCSLGQNINMNEPFTGIQTSMPTTKQLLDGVDQVDSRIGTVMQLQGVVSDDPFEGALDQLYTLKEEDTHAKAEL